MVDMDPERDKPVSLAAGSGSGPSMKQQKRRKTNITEDFNCLKGLVINQSDQCAIHNPDEDIDFSKFGSVAEEVKALCALRKQMFGPYFGMSPSLSSKSCKRELPHSPNQSLSNRGSLANMVQQASPTHRYVVDLKEEHLVDVAAAPLPIVIIDSDDENVSNGNHSSPFDAATSTKDADNELPTMKVSMPRQRLPIEDEGASPEAGSSQLDGDIDMDSEHDVQYEDNQGSRTRGPTTLNYIWSIKDGRRIIVPSNEFNQPVDIEGGVLARFLGTLARKAHLCPVSFTRWDALKRATNMHRTILQEVEMRFKYPKAMEKWILKSLGNKWRNFKHLLHDKYFDESSTAAALSSITPPYDIPSNHWDALVRYWYSPEGLRASKIGKESRAKAGRISTHTSGTKSFARRREEMRKSKGKTPRWDDFFAECHKDKTYADVRREIKERVAQEGRSQGSKSQIIPKLRDEDMLGVLGVDRCGRVRGIGLGVTRAQINAQSGSLADRLNMTSDGTSDSSAIQVSTLEGQLSKVGVEMSKMRSQLSQMQSMIKSLMQGQVGDFCNAQCQSLHNRFSHVSQNNDVNLDYE